MSFSHQCHKFKVAPILRLPVLVCALIYIFVYVPQISADTSEHLHLRDGKNVPCAFLDTVNVTDDKRFANGSYLHDGILIPRHLVGLYDYIYKDVSHRIDVEPHYRGCICKLKTCINFCCPWGTKFSNNISACVNTSDEIAWPSPVLNITLPDESLKSVNIFEQFAVQNFRPCERMFSLQPEMNSFDGWHIFENGSMLRLDDYKYFSKYEYCLVPTIVNETDSVYIINPANCNVESEFGTMKIINACAMLFSIPFMVLTIIVYLAIPELRNQHGKSLVCYLLGLIIGYSLLSCIALFNTFTVSDVTCRAVGYTAYYFFMSAFFWLSVISFDLWHNFRGTHGINRFKEKKRFIIYSLYAWGLAAIFLLFTWYAQEYLDIPAYYKPGIGSEDLCWLEMTSWSAMIYFFGPIMLVIIANIIMFVMTAMKIHKVQREMARIMAREDSTRNLRSEKDRFGLFLRLFIVMGVTWSLEIMSYFVGSEKAWSKIFYITDICNATQGFLIFMLFVMKKKVKNLITNSIEKLLNNYIKKFFKQRFFKCCKSSGQKSQSNSTYSTHSAISTISEKFDMKSTNNVATNDNKDKMRF